MGFLTHYPKMFVQEWVDPIGIKRRDIWRLVRPNGDYLDDFTLQMFGGGQTMHISSIIEDKSFRSPNRFEKLLYE